MTKEKQTHSMDCLMTAIELIRRKENWSVQVKICKSENEIWRQKSTSYTFLESSPSKLRDLYRRISGKFLDKKKYLGFSRQKNHWKQTTTYFPKAIPITLEAQIHKSPWQDPHSMRITSLKIKKTK